MKRNISRIAVPVGGLLATLGIGLTSMVLAGFTPAQWAGSPDNPFSPSDPTSVIFQQVQTEGPDGIVHVGSPVTASLLGVKTEMFSDAFPLLRPGARGERTYVKVYGSEQSATYAISVSKLEVRDAAGNIVTDPEDIADVLAATSVSMQAISADGSIQSFLGSFADLVKFGYHLIDESSGDAFVVGPGERVIFDVSSSVSQDLSLKYLGWSISADIRVAGDLAAESILDPLDPF